MTSESAAAERPESYFSVFDLLTSPSTFPQGHGKLSRQKVHQKAVATLDSLGYLSEPGAWANFNLSLSLHAATPKIEAFYQHYNDAAKPLDKAVPAGEDGPCISWVDWHGERTCDLETLKALYEDYHASKTL